MTVAGQAIKLTGRGVISVSGPDAAGFLQGLITNDIRNAGPGRALYAALLTPQGKYLHDFFIIGNDGGFLLDCERQRRADLLRRLMMYKLRAKAEITDLSEKMTVWAVFGTGDAEGIVFDDPRHPGLGRRVIVEKGVRPHRAVAPFKTYETLRLALGIPDGSRDMAVEKTFILEANLDELSGIDFLKGCYVGQEMTARMKHRTTVKKRLLPVTLDGDAPPAGTPVLDESGKTAGDIRSGLNGRAIAYLKLEALVGRRPLSCDGLRLTPEIPDWLQGAITA